MIMRTSTVQLHVEEELPVHVEITGQGPAVILISSAAPAEWWREQVPIYAREHQVINYDYRAPEGWSRPAEPRNSAQLGMHAGQILDKLGITQAHVNGISGGARAAAFLAAARPGLVQRLVLTAPGPADLERAWRELTQNPGAHRILTDMEYASSLEPEHRLREYAQSVFAADFVEREPALVRRLLGPRDSTVKRADEDVDFTGGDEIRCPALVIVGDRDRLALLPWAQDYQRMIPDAQLVVLGGATHGLLVEDPARYGSVVSRFLTGHWLDAREKTELGAW